MSRRLREFVQMISEDKASRSETEMAGFIVWLRRRCALLKNLESSVLMDIMRHADHMSLERDGVLFQQGEHRTVEDPLRFFLFLRGSSSMLVNKFLAAAHSVQSGARSSPKSRATISPEKLLLAPKSASSMRNTKSARDLTMHDDDSDVSDADSDVSVETAVTKYANNQTETFTSKEEHPTPVSKLSRTPRAKFGRFVVKYEKGKYFTETAVLDDDGVYTATILANELCDILVLNEEFFNTSIKEHHERDTTEILEFVDVHPFFSNLPLRAKGVLQIVLRKHHFNTGDFIVRQEEPAKRLFFIVNGSAEVIIEPAKHRYQYPEYWPFETSKDVYFNEFEWLREFRRKAHSKKYYQHTEADFTHKQQKVEVSLCAVQKKEVIGITEHVLQLNTFMQSVRCLQPTEVYSLSTKPFNRLIRRRSPDTMDLIRAYVHTKLKFRMKHSLGEKVPLLHSLCVKAEREYREKSLKGFQTTSWEKLRQREKDMLKLLDWFKLDKAELVQHMDVNVLKMKDTMRKKAERRQKCRKDMKFENTFKRYGCLATVKAEREPMSLRALRDPMNEVILKLKMAGTHIRDEEDLETFLLSYTRDHEDDIVDIEEQTNRVTEEEVNLLHYRRRGNKLVRRFLHLLSHKGRRTPLTKEETLISNILLEHYHPDEESEEEEKLPVIDEASDDLTRDLTRDHSGLTAVTSDMKQGHSGLVDGNSALTRGLSALTISESQRTRIQSGRTSFDGWRTRKSVASSYKTYQFERRDIAPSGLEERIRNFLTKYGGKENEINTLPEMRAYDQFEADDPPIPGGKVFVTTVPCMSEWKNVHIKNHRHERCMMLHSLPMSKVKERSPTVYEEDDDESIRPTTFQTLTTFRSPTTYQTSTTNRTSATLRSATTLRTQVTLQTPATIRSSEVQHSPAVLERSPTMV